MKKLIILLLGSQATFAQVGIPLKTNNEKEVFTLIHELGKITAHQLAKVDSSFDDKGVIKFYLSKANCDTIEILFYKRTLNGNKQWSYTSLTGKYADVISIWKKYFNAKADDKLITSNGADRNRDYKPTEQGWYSNIWFRKQNNDRWIIR